MDNRTRAQLLRIMMAICIVTLLAITLGAVISQFLPKDPTPGETPGDSVHFCTPGVAVRENEVQATCKVAGRYDEVTYCTECNEETSRVRKTIPKLKTHTPGASVKENEIPATCISGGSYDLVVYCSVCKEAEISRTHKTTEPGDTHSEKTVIENLIEPTCKEGGSYDEVVYCSDCGIEISRTTVETDKTEEHVPATQVKENEVAATCKAGGSYDLVTYCSVCELELDRATQIVPIQKHRYGRDGICAICGDKASIELQFVSNGDGTCYVAGLGVCTDTEIFIPERSPIGDLVVGIGESAFDDCKSITAVTIPVTVKSIGGYAFRGCTDLTKVYYFGTIAEWCAISFCSYSNPLSYGAELYIRDQKVNDLVIPASVTHINDYAFYNCGSLTSVSFEEYSQIMSIGSYAFRNCKNLTSVEFPDGCSLSSIGKSAFYGCSSLESITIPAGVRRIDENTFYGCTSLVGIGFAEGSMLESIGDSAFWGCKSLESILLPEGIESIGDKAFCGCASLTSISLPGSITEIGKDAFYGCAGLAYNSDESAYYLGNESNPYLALIKVKDSFITSCTINAETRIICNGAFSECRGLEKIVIPEKVVSIGEGAFYNCMGLTELEFAQGGCLTTIGESAFYGCKSLKKVVLPESVKLVGHEAFYGCSSLESVTIPAGVVSIGGSAFYGCMAIESVYYTGNIEGWCGIAFSNYAANPLCYTADLYFGDALVTDVVIPDGVTEIGDYAFIGCESIKSIAIPESVTEIGEKAFYRCPNLTIYCAAQSKPDSWGSSWNPDSLPVIWGHVIEEDGEQGGSQDGEQSGSQDGEQSGEQNG